MYTEGRRWRGPVAPPAGAPTPDPIPGYSSKGGAVGVGCSGWGEYYVVDWYITSYKSLHPVSTAPPFDES